jgi:hypothetical protein
VHVSHLKTEKEEAMTAVMEMQPWGTVACETANQARVLDMDKVIDTMRFESCILCIEVTKVANGQLEIEGTDSLGGVWDRLDLPITTAVRETYMMLRRTDDTEAASRMPRYLRWRVKDGGAGTLEVCFRITCTFR